MVIVSLIIWKDKIMTLNATPYYLADGSAYNVSDVNKTINVGSYWYAADSWTTVFSATRGSGTDDKANVAL